MVGLGVGCGDDASGESGTTVGDSSATSATGSSGSASASATDTSGGSGSATGTTAADSTGEGSGSSEGSGTATTGAMTCDFEMTLGELAEGKMDPIDCGVVSFEDDDEAWADANGCAVDALMTQAAFHVGFQGESIDSTLYDGFFGTSGIVYGLGRVHYDTLGEPVLGFRPCEDIVPLADCTPVSGTHCLECIQQGELTPIDCVP